MVAHPILVTEGQPDMSQGAVPKIADLGGVTIMIHYREHPPPHFHARQAGREDRIQIDPVQVMSGDLPRSQRRMVLEWAKEHQAALVEAWKAAEERRPVPQIAPVV
jgi:hypothetical protein